MIDVSNLKDTLKTLGFIAYGDIYSALLLASEFWTKNLHRMVQFPFTAPMSLRHLALLTSC